MKPTTLLLVRHAEVEPRYQRVFGGRIDMELSDTGHRQARALAAYLGPEPFAAIYGSPLKRVQQTLAPLTGNGHPQAVILDDLREVHFGAWTGLGWGEIEATFGVRAEAWLHELAGGTMPGAESGRALLDRVERSLDRIVGAHTGQQVAVFCHGGVIRAALALLLDLPLEKMSAFEIDYASITRIKVQNSAAEVQLLNFTPWRVRGDA